MKKNLLTQKLKDLGFEIILEPYETIKNTVIYKGFRVIMPECPETAPVFYYDESETEEEIAMRIAGELIGAMPVFDPFIIEDADYVKENIYLSVSKRNGEAKDVIKKELLNLDVFMKIIIVYEGEIYCIKVTEEVLSASGLGEESAWNFASDNSRSGAKISGISEFVKLPKSTLAPIYIAKTKFDGASVLCFPDLFEDFCEMTNWDSLIILPSSTQEMIVLPEIINNTADLMELVECVNRENVEPVQQLEPAVYRFYASTGRIELASCRNQAQEV